MDQPDAPGLRGAAAGRRSGVNPGRSPRLVRAAAVGSIVAVLAQAPVPAAGDPRPVLEPAPARRETDALVASLRARIGSARSATLVLEGWCAEHRLAPDARIVAHRLPVADKPPSAAQRERLAVGPDEPVRYRRVRLACGDRVLSEADNWYVPARLDPEMNAALDGTRAPFGRVVRPLDPVRRTLGVRVFETRPEPGPDDPLFAVEALLVTGAGAPFCEVAETYLGGALPAADR